MKKIAILLSFFILSLAVRADEGMWLPSLIYQKIGDMQEKGFKLTAQDIYSINQASLKDAVVHFNGGCTGEIVSDKGLLLTNHHCGYGQIQAHSSVENDYLRDGFWAMTMNEELPNRNMRISILEWMDDVTGKVLKGYTAGMSEQERADLVRKNSDDLIKEATKEGKGLRARVDALFYGNQYVIYVFRDFTDVRLVGAPPSSIGKFGGDTDNWMWPRHTGDFSIFRIYADKDNNPAPYSPDNVPYKPKKFFKVSTAGVNEGDFTFVYGFPGRTQQYITSDAVEYIVERSNPHKIMLRTLRLDIQREEMAKDRGVRIQYSSKNAGVSNSWKKWQGEMKGIIKMNTVQNKREFEKTFKAWAKGNPEYDGLLEKMEALYSELSDYSFVSDYYNESIAANELPAFAGRILTALARNAAVDNLIDAFFKDYYLPIDKRSFVAIVSKYNENIAENFRPEYFKNKMKELGSVEALADHIYSNSVFLNENELRSLVADSSKHDLLMADPAAEFYSQFREYQMANIANVTSRINREITSLYHDYMRGQIEFDKERIFYPDANGTLRVAYGEVTGYRPSDAVYYKPSSTLDGIMEKDNPEIFDYDIPQRLRDIYASKDYGRWAVDGTVPVCFIATNHTSGGNSGSPVINANGELIGINFDRVWEGTMSDIVFDPEICRNISIDIRYLLFVVDRLAGATHLIDEMTLVN